MRNRGLRAGVIAVAWGTLAHGAGPKPATPAPTTKGNTPSAGGAVGPAPVGPVGPAKPAPGPPRAEVEAAADRVCENWGFERGLECWTDASATQPSAFAVQPTFGENVVARRVAKQMEYAAGGIGGDYWTRLSYPVGGVKTGAGSRPKSQFWIGTAEARPSADYRVGTVRGDAPQGELRSKPFRVRTRYLSFLVGGGKSANVGVSLQVPAYQGKGNAIPSTKDGWVEVAVARGNDSDVMRRETWDLATILGTTLADVTSGKLVARITIFDFDTGKWGHVNVDDFAFGSAPSGTFPVTENGTVVLRDDDMPVWGFADTHAHPTHQIAFGGKTILGATDGPMDVALSSGQCTAFHTGVLRVMGGRNHMHAAIGVVDEHTPEGYPTFIGWPTYRTKTHQVQHVDWIRRAFDGGQRLLVALGVTNMFWATRALGPGQSGVPIDDETIALKQIRLMREIVGRQASWMEIATSPAHARRIIHQGKMAVVLGLEVDNFGNFKDASYTWKDGENYPIPPSAPLVALPSDPSAARTVIRQKLETYFNNELVRQVTPLHYVSGVFGGTAVFRGQFALINQTMTGRRYMLRNAPAAEGIAYNMDKDWSGFQGFLGTVLGASPILYLLCPEDAGTFCKRSSVNAEGLTPRGNVLTEELMRRGMLVDTEHASLLSAAAMSTIAARFRYPLMSSHSDVRELSFSSRTGKSFVGDADKDLQEFGTSQVGNITHEGMLGKSGFDRVRDTGGTAGVITMAYRKHGYPNDAAPYVANDCDGSSKTFAQSYLYAVDKLGGRGVAIATDRGFTDFIGPRFGTHAAYRLRDEPKEQLHDTRRTAQRWAQRNGVRYDIDFKFFHPSRFEFGEVTAVEEDAWKAMAYLAARKLGPLDARYAGLRADDKIPPSSEAGHDGRIESFVRGLTATSEAQLRGCCGDTPFEEAAMFCAKQGTAPDVFAKASRFAELRSNYAHFNAIFERAKSVYVLWNAMRGANEPLRKRVDGVRDWDVNVDGVAHYGMLPDMLQDMANVGVTPAQLTPLFASAEDYLQMWERAEVGAQSARAALPK